MLISLLATDALRDTKGTQASTALPQSRHREVGGAIGDAAAVMSVPAGRRAPVGSNVR
jgi:hypothetical protein